MKKKKFSKLRELNRKRNYFIKSLRLNIARIFIDHRIKKRFEISEIKKILFLRDDDKIGDMVVSTSLYREFYQRGYSVDVLAGKNSASVIYKNPYIRKIHLTQNGKIGKLRQAKFLSKNNYDAVIDMGDKISPFSLLFLKTLNAKNYIGFNKEGFKIYNKSIVYLGYDKHISERYYFLLEALGFENFRTDYDIFISKEVRKETDCFMRNLPKGKKIVINPFAADRRRDMSLKQLDSLLKAIGRRWADVVVILIVQPERRQEIKEINAVINPFASLESACEIIHQADAVISPDTSVVHIAATWKKPMVCLYGNDIHGNFVNSLVWGPGYQNAIQILTKDKFHPVSTINIEEIIDALTRLAIFNEP